MSRVPGSYLNIWIFNSSAKQAKKKKRTHTQQNAAQQVRNVSGWSLETTVELSRLFSLRYRAKCGHYIMHLVWLEGPIEYTRVSHVRNVLWCMYSNGCKPCGRAKLQLKRRHAKSPFIYCGLHSHLPRHPAEQYFVNVSFLFRLPIFDE